MPDAVEAFTHIARDEAFWLDIVNAPSGAFTPAGVERASERPMHWDELYAFAGMVSRIVDFRSSFTATHTAGVASTAMALGRLVGMGEREVSRLGVAGNLHDVGKLAVPPEILVKPGPLDPREWAVMKTHTYYTHKVLTAGGALSEIAGLAAYHHERLDGNGYPFHVEAAGLDEGARLMAVADIFTAVSEDRPYRAGMEKDAVVSVLRESAERHATDRDLVEALIGDFDDINGVRVEAQSERRGEFVDFKRALDERAGLVRKEGRGAAGGAKAPAA
jgi:HD-GYP domain-containing protein (c-di-GMP phosphodiesterase class II)